MANRFPLIFNSGAGQIQELAASDNLDLTSSNLVNAGILFTSSGSVTAPSLQIGSGTTYNPGLYSPGTDQLAVATNGTSRLSIDASGNVAVDTNTLYVDAVNNRVAIGTTSPIAGYLLDVRGSMYMAGTNSRIYVDNGGVGGSSVQIGVSGTSHGYIGTDGNFPLVFQPNNTERARIRADGTFEIKGAGTAGTSPGFSVNPSTPANSFVIDSSGRLGIGSSAPTGNLSFGATDAIINSDTSDASDNKSVSLAGGGTASTARGGYMQLYGNEYTTTGGVVDINSGNVANSYVRIQGRSSSSDIRFWINASEAGRFDTSGRLLIGTSTSRSVQDFAGNGPESLIQIEAANSTAIMSIISAGTADASRGGTLSLGRHRNATVGATPTVVQSGDLLGAICFAGGDGTDMLTKGASIACQVDGTPGSDDMPGRLVFSTTADGGSSPTERMRISSTGNISIGTTTDLGYKLGIIATTTATPSLYLRSSAAGDVGTAQIRIMKADATSTTSQIFIQFVIDGNNVNSGQINANGVSQAAFGSFSDVRLKENIENLPSQINNIKALRPVEFDYKDKSGHQIGFVAQEMEQIYPDAIGVGENEMLTVTGWSKTEARLVKALQEAITKIETLEARLTAAGID